MSRPSKKPLYSIIVLFCVACAIYYVATGDQESMGAAGPLNSLKNVDHSAYSGSGLKNNDNAKSAGDLATFYSGASEEPDQADTSQNIASESGTASKFGANTNTNAKSNTNAKYAASDDSSDSDGFTETPFMPKMANETLKAQLGNSAWHLFHTVLARYPESPSTLEKNTLKQYIHLFAQVYPCGDCARHFQQLLKRYPVQVGSRKTAALWGCHVHNKVNERLSKPEYDCTKILEDYDCGCGTDEAEEDATLGNETAQHLREMTLDETEGRQLGG